MNTQANKFTAQHADARIEVFLEKFLEENLRQEQVDEAIATLSKLKVPDIKWLKFFQGLCMVLHQKAYFSPGIQFETFFYFISPSITSNYGKYPP